MQSLKPLVAILAIAAMGMDAATAATDPASNYPQRPIRLMVPNAPGASVDTLSRIVATSLSEVLGHQVDEIEGAQELHPLILQDVAGEEERQPAVEVGPRQTQAHRQLALFLRQL